MDWRFHARAFSVSLASKIRDKKEGARSEKVTGMPVVDGDTLAQLRRVRQCFFRGVFIEALAHE